MIETLLRRFRETLEVAATSSGGELLRLRMELADLTDQILEARILDGIDPLPPRVDISHVEWDLP